MCPHCEAVVAAEIVSGVLDIRGWCPHFIGFVGDSLVPMFEKPKAQTAGASK